MKRTLLALIATVAIVATAQAGTASWFKNAQWAVTVDTRGFCTASSLYPGKGITLTLGVTAAGEVKVFLNGTNAVQGNTYTNVFRTGPSIGSFVGYAGAPGMLSYTVTPDTLLKFAYAKTLYIQNMGEFDMTGSKQAVLEMMKCRLAMLGKDA